MPTMNLDTSDAVELAELLQFLYDWLDTDPGRLSESLNDFAGSSAYDLVELRTDLNRFTFLLGIGDGEGLFRAKAEWRSGRPTPDSSEGQVVSWMLIRIRLTPKVSTRTICAGQPPSDSRTQ